MVVKNIDRILLIAPLDNASKSNLKHSKLSESKHVMRNLFCSLEQRALHVFLSLINIRNEKRKSEGLETLNFATFQRVITVYK